MNIYKHSLQWVTRGPGLAPSIVIAGFLGLLATPVWADKITLVAFGDSLTAGYGVGPNESFPAQLELALRRKGYDIDVHNAGVSGDTTAAGLARLDWSIGEDAQAVIVTLGANDALRGLPASETEKNLAAIVSRFSDRDLPVVVAGMLAPRNLGAVYAAEFDPIFSRVAKAHKAIFYPFFLDGVAVDPSLNQRDGIHPNPEGVKVIVAKILPSVEKLIRRIK